MVKGNQRIPNGHFHKDWQRRVRTWFDQPAKKKSRRMKRQAKAASIFPRPVEGALRPIVRCPTIRCNIRRRQGRGFTVAELKAAGIPRLFAPTIGLSVDKRRKNRSEQAFQDNVQRLKKYRANLILFPRKEAKPKKADSSAEECKNAQQVKGTLMPFRSRPALKAESMAIPEPSKTSAFVTLRKARTDARLVGRRIKRIKNAEERKKEGASGKSKGKK